MSSKAKSTDAARVPATPQEREAAATLLHNVGLSAVCFTTNVARLGYDLADRFAAGEMDRGEYDDLRRRLDNAQQDMEAACRAVSRVRALLTTGLEAAHDHGTGG